MKVMRPLVVLLAACACACARQPTQSSIASPPASAGPHEHAPVDYSKYITRAVGMFSFSSLYSWDSNDPGHAVVWTTPFEAYRLTLLGPCFELQHAPIIALTSHGGTVTAGFDSVLVRGDQCRIQSIEKLDAKAIRAAGNQKRD